MKLDHQPRNQTSQALRVDLYAALAAGICAGAFTCFISAQNRQQIVFLDCARFLLLSMAAYMAVALLLHRLWTGTLRRLLPNWILIAVFGSLLFTCVRLLPGVIKGWSSVDAARTSLIEYVFTELSAGRSVVIFLSIITLPTAAAAYYAKSIARAMLPGYGGQVKALSILEQAKIKDTAHD